MKTLKRQFNMTKEEVEWNMRYLPWHRAYIKAYDDMAAVRADDSLSFVQKQHEITMIRMRLREEMRKHDEV